MAEETRTAYGWTVCWGFPAGLSGLPLRESCLSDLRSIPSERLFLVAESIPEDAFSRESWAQAMSYLTGKTAADPRRSLLSALRA